MSLLAQVRFRPSYPRLLAPKVEVGGAWRHNRLPFSRSLAHHNQAALRHLLQRLPHHIILCGSYRAFEPWDYLDVDGIGSFPTCLDVSIFLLRKGANGKITALAPFDGPSYFFTFMSDGTKEWSDDLAWETLRGETHAQIQACIGPKGGELLIA